MESQPLVSIVVAVFNDDDVVAGALDSCLRQTLTAIEILVVDDASSDRTAEVVKRYADRDARVQLIRHERNMSAFQARKTGILAARAEHLLFLDGDDELSDDAAETALARAEATGADLVQFGVEVVHRDGSTGGSFEQRLQPRFVSLSGPDVLSGLFPLDRPAQGHLWRCLYRTQLLREAYALVADDLILPRVNDLPITFLAAALATSYASITNRLYRYYFGRGGSGQQVRDYDQAVFYASAIQSISAIAPAVNELSSRSDSPDLVIATYESARQWIIGYTTHYLATHTKEELREATFMHLCTRASPSEIVHATAKFWPKSLNAVAAHASSIQLSQRPVRSVLLTTNVLRTGGVSGVLLSQAKYLMRAGVTVTIAARGSGSDRSAVPEGAHFLEVDVSGLGAQVTEWAAVCRKYAVDLVIDHHWLYSKNWPAFALAARAEGAATIGWAHNFAGRAVLLGLKSIEFQRRHIGALDKLVVLSPLDVVFWKLQGAPRVVYLPNPPSPLLLEHSVGRPKPAPSGRPIELVWWGRLEQGTKRVTELVRVAVHLQRLGIDFRMRIIGPDWDDMTAERLNALAQKKGVAGRVTAIGPLRGQDLIAAIDSSDVFVNTSIIEGYPLTIPEAQSRGLPVAMYELPWLLVVDANDGIVTAPQGDASNLAARIADLVASPQTYAKMSAASIVAARREVSYDFATLYMQLTSRALPAEFSPEPTLATVQRLINLMILFSRQRTVPRTTPNRRKRMRKSPTARVVRSSDGDGDGDGDETLLSTAFIRLEPVARAALGVAPWLRRPALRLRHAVLRHKA